MKLQIQPIIKDLIAQHDLPDDEYGKIVEISESEPNLMRRLR
jgi:hypothetical protein